MKKLFLCLVMSIIFISNNHSYCNDFDIIDDYITKHILKDKEKIITNTKVVLGDEQLFTPQYSCVIDSKKIGVIANQTSVNSKGEHIKDVLYNYKNATLTSLYAPEHGIDGKVPAGKYVSSYIDKTTNLPIYSLYGETREPSSYMLGNIDVMLFDLQDIGSRTYTYISTMYKSMEACKKNNKTFVVLDRPNPISCKYVEGFVLEDEALSFVGIDNMPMAHGMTAGELAKFFNRKIGVNLVVIPMKNYKRDMIWQETGLNFVQTSPYIPNIQSAFSYMATGQSENMGIGMSDSFTWSGGSNINSNTLAQKLNSYNLEGVNFIPQNKSSRGGVRVNITDYKKFNPAKVGYYIMATANEQKNLSTVLYDSNNRPTMFYKISGSKKFTQAIKSKKSAIELEMMYRQEADKFRLDTQKYYIYE